MYKNSLNYIFGDTWGRCLHTNKVIYINKKMIHSNNSNNSSLININETKNKILESNILLNNNIEDIPIKDKKILIKKLFGGVGYSSYKYFISLGNVEELSENENLLLNNLKPFMDSLEDTKTYTVLSVIRWINYNGETQGITMGNAIKLTNRNSIRLLAKKLKLDIGSALIRYKVESSECELVLMYREWLDISEFNSKLEDIADAIDKDLSKELNKKIIFNDNNIQKRIDNFIYDYNHVFMDNYGKEIRVNNKLIGYKLSDNEGAVVHKIKGENGFTVNLVTVKEIINDKFNLENMDLNIIKWTDTQTDDGFIREINKIKIYFNKLNNIYKIEGEYTFPDFPVTDMEFYYNDKIGCLDFETYGDNGLGNQSVYAGGWCVKDLMELFYINPEESSDELVTKLIESIFNHPDLDNYTFFAHNLGRFDSLFLIKGLVANKYISIKPVWKDNKIISIVIKHEKLNRKIKLLDSMNFIPGNLRDILISFNCENKKTYFPYSFVNKDNLFYIGNKPDIKYYNNISKYIYDKIPMKWNLHTETLKYLESDLKGLLEVMNKFSVNIFNEYNLNITKFKTLPALSLGIFTSNFYAEVQNLNIKMIKGKVEEDIRNSYFGGNVGVFANEINKGFLYDINSQYPKAMLEDMPVGNPVYTTEKNLDNIFGFVYGKVIAPSPEVLKIPFIQVKDPKTGLVSCPRGEFYRMMFTEEIKYAIKHGYKFEILYGYQFKKGKLFTDFVNIHYENKKNAPDPIKKHICKLLLNSLYGKFGMKDIESILKVVPVAKANFIKKNYNYSIFAHLTDDKVLIRYSSRINETLRNFFKKQDEMYKVNESKMNEIGLGKNRGVNSAVHIASAISSYARIIINEYKNIPDNPCIMSDTDSVVLLNKLDDSVIGTELGQMKLESEIVHGIFIRKKLYAIKTKYNNIIIKCSGTNRNSLVFDDFIDMLNGKEVETFRLSFVPVWDKMNLKITKNMIKLKGLVNLPIKIIDERVTHNLVLTNTNSSTQIAHQINYPIINLSKKSYPVILYIPKTYSIIKYLNTSKPLVDKIDSIFLLILKDICNFFRRFIRRLRNFYFYFRKFIHPPNKRPPN